MRRIKVQKVLGTACAVHTSGLQLLKGLCKLCEREHAMQALKHGARRGRKVIERPSDYGCHSLHVSFCYVYIIR